MKIQRHAGFTLVELLVTVTIVAILAAIAYPSYENHLRKGRRAAAQSFLVDLASREQQYLLDARAFAVGADALTQLSLPVPVEVSKFYTVSVDPAAAASPPGFTAKATPLATTSQSADGVLTLDSTGARTRNGVAGW